jgi:hypothetical protein
MACQRSENWPAAGAQICARKASRSAIRNSLGKCATMACHLRVSRASSVAHADIVRAGRHRAGASVDRARRAWSASHGARRLTGAVHGAVAIAGDVAVAGACARHGGARADIDEAVAGACAGRIALVSAQEVTTSRPRTLEIAAGNAVDGAIARGWANAVEPAAFTGRSLHRIADRAVVAVVPVPVFARGERHEGKAEHRRKPLNGCRLHS